MGRRTGDGNRSPPSGILRPDVIPHRNLLVGQVANYANRGCSHVYQSILVALRRPMQLLTSFYCSKLWILQIYWPEFTCGRSLSLGLIMLSAVDHFSLSSARLLSILSHRLAYSGCAKADSRGQCAMVQAM